MWIILLDPVETQLHGFSVVPASQKRTQMLTATEGTYAVVGLVPLGSRSNHWSQYLETKFCKSL